VLAGSAEVQVHAEEVRVVGARELGEPEVPVGAGGPLVAGADVQDPGSVDGPPGCCRTPAGPPVGLAAGGPSD